MPIILIVYAMILFYFWDKIRSFLKENYRSSERLKISLIIAFHNEEKRIEPCIESIKKLSYAIEDYEVIWVNDRSSDRSCDLIRNIAMENWKLIDIDSVPDGFSPKKYAIQTAIVHSSYENLAFTDADCQLPENYLTAVAEALSNGDVALGSAALTHRNLSLVTAAQETETFLNHCLMLISLAHQKPLICFGRNWAYKKQAFADVSAFDGHSQLLSGDDDLLLRKFKTKAFRFSWIKELNVPSASLESFTHFFRQKARHFTVISQIPLSERLFAFSFHALHLFFLLSLYTHPIYLCIKLGIDFLFIFYLKKILYDVSTLRMTILANFFYYPMMIILTIYYLLKRKHINWN